MHKTWQNIGHKVLGTLPIGTSVTVRTGKRKGLTGLVAEYDSFVEQYRLMAKDGTHLGFFDWTELRATR